MTLIAPAIILLPIVLALLWAPVFLQLRQRAPHKQADADGAAEAVFPFHCEAE